jgi:hypothetical protein
VLPHLDTFNLRAHAAYGVLPETDLVLAAAAYAVLYAGSTVALASAVFSAREFR